MKNAKDERKCSITGGQQRYTVKMSLTKGELLALKNALEEYDTIVGRDVREYLLEAMVGIHLLV